MPDNLEENAQLALDTIQQARTKGIPSWLIHPMEHSIIERLAGAAPGEYKKDPARVYLAMQKAIGTCMLDQWIPDNPMTMGDHGYEAAEKGATTGADTIIRDGITIDSPEAVVEHMEKVAFPQWRKALAEFDEEKAVREILAAERQVQALFGPDILKVPYACVQFPGLEYWYYGYEGYFMAYALYPEVVERHFSVQADWAVRHNRAVARAYAEGYLPPLARLDYDMADSRGTLVNIASLDKLWFPHFARSLAPLLKTDVKMIWHCDGNLMAMVPRLLEVGLHGFQGFQYEDGMDYAEICKMKTRSGDDLIIIGGVSVTRTLPHGTPDDVKRQMRWLVEKGPATGLFLGGSSSIAPGVPWANIVALVEGLNYYRIHGRSQA